MWAKASSIVSREFRIVAIAAKHSAVVSFLEAEFGVQSQGRAVFLHGLRFHDRYALAGQVAKGLGEQKRRQSLAAVLAIDVQFGQPGGSSEAGAGDRVHAPHHGVGQHGAAAARPELNPRHVEITRRAGFPPGSRRRIDDDLDHHAAAELDQLPVHRWPKIQQIAAQDDGALDFRVAVLGKRLPGDKIGVEYPRQLASAVEAQVERIQGTDPAAVEDLGPALAQVGFTSLEQPRGHFPLVVVRPNHDHARHAQLGREPALLFVGSEPGMGESHGLVVFQREDQALRIEVELGQQKLLDQIHRDRSCQTRLADPAAPQGDQQRRVRVAK